MTLSSSRTLPSDKGKRESQGRARVEHDASPPGRRSGAAAPDDRPDVLRQIAERRHDDLVAGQPRVQIAAEAARRRCERARGSGGSRATTRTSTLTTLGGADRPHLAALEQAGAAPPATPLGQLGDLVEEQGAAVGGQRARPGRSSVAPEKAPRRCPNSSLSINVGGKSAAVGPARTAPAGPTGRGAPLPPAPCRCRSRQLMRTQARRSFATAGDRRVWRFRNAADRRADQLAQRLRFAQPAIQASISRRRVVLLRNV